MSDDQGIDLKKGHSLYCTKSFKHGSQSETHCKSDGNLLQQNDSNDSTGTRKRDKLPRDSGSHLGDYYKKYEHDELPVKDSNFYDLTAIGDKVGLTGSDLDKLEMKIFENRSQEIRTDSSSISSLESNIKFFKTTVQEIFDNFNASMQDFELYKRRFHEILNKNREDAIQDMDQFIKDMIQHIMSSESGVSCDSRKSNIFIEVRDKETNVSSNLDDSSIGRNTSTDTNYTEDANVDSVLQTYKNENYLTDSTLNEKTPKANRCAIKEEILNIFLLGGRPCIQIKMNDRNLLSEINIKEPNSSGTESNLVASADNLKRVAEKKMEMEEYVKYQLDYDVPDRAIPVKESYARKDIHMVEEFDRERERNKSFMSKICGFLCKTFRKTSFS